MIECTEKKILKRKRTGKRRFLLFSLFALFIAIPVVYSKYCVSAVVSEICRDKTYAFSAKAVNEAVLQSAKTADYTDLVTVVKNENGDITLISADSLKMNALGNEIVKTTKLLLESELKNGIEMPWLAFSGIKFLSGYGKEVTFKAITVSAITCDFCGEFRSVGINQTLHSIYTQIICEIKINMPIEEQRSRCETKVLLAESVLVGKVPEIYLGNKE